MWVLRSKVNGKLFSDIKNCTFIWDNENPYIFKDFSERCWYMPGKMRANVYAQVIDPEDVWQMVAEEIGECL
jgi:hypothetical protein